VGDKSGNGENEPKPGNGGLDASQKVAGDLLRGLKAIGDEIGLSMRQTHYGLTQGRIPAGREGTTWIASRRVLREHFRKLTSG
jgi:hypothetical protein